MQERNVSTTEAKRLAEAWRQKAGRIQTKYTGSVAPKNWLEHIVAAFETCAEELEELTKGTK